MSFSYVDILIVAVQDRRRLFYICLASGGKYDTNVSKAQGVSNARGEERGKKNDTNVMLFMLLSWCLSRLSRFSRAPLEFASLFPRTRLAL